MCNAGRICKPRDGRTAALACKRSHRCTSMTVRHFPAAACLSRVHTTVSAAV